jgi:hypothetical protein
LLFFEKRKASYFVTYRLQIYELISSLFSFSQILIEAKEERWEEMRLQITFWKGDNGRQVQCVSAYQSAPIARLFREHYNYYKRILIRKELGIKPILFPLFVANLVINYYFCNRNPKGTHDIFAL